MAWSDVVVLLNSWALSESIFAELSARSPDQFHCFLPEFFAAQSVPPTKIQLVLPTPPANFSSSSFVIFFHLSPSPPEFHSIPSRLLGTHSHFHQPIAPVHSHPSQTSHSHVDSWSSRRRPGDKALEPASPIRRPRCCSKYHPQHALLQSMRLQHRCCPQQLTAMRSCD